MKVPRGWALAAWTLLGTGLVSGLTTGAGAQAKPVKRALLIGIDQYTPDPLPARLPVLPAGHAPDSRFGEGPAAWINLSGPTFDVQSMKLVLQQKYGFGDITVLTDAEATRAGILDAIQKDLIAPSRPGDLDVFYFAGHGSQRLDTGALDANPDKNHMDETIVPADAFQGAYDIRDKELARLFDQVLAKQAKLVAIFDSCHSGSMARGLRAGTARYLAYDDRDVAKDPTAYQGADLDRLPADNPNFILLTAALSTQSANEFHYADTGHDQGVFTRALVAALRNAGPGWRAVDVLNSVQADLRADNWDQQPTIEGNLNASLFGDASTSHPLRAAVVAAANGVIQLNLGSVAGIAAGTELTSLSPGGDGKPAVLQVASVDSPLRSRARLVSGAMTFQGGELFQVSRLVLAGAAQLRIYVPGLDGAVPPRPPAAARAHFPGMRWVDDPAAAPYELILPGRAGWETIAPPHGAATGATAFLALPPPAALIAQLRTQPAVAGGSVALTGDRASAEYYLLGRPKPEAPGTAQFALVSPEAFGAPPQPAFIVNSDVACSTGAMATSAPVRGPWVDAAAPYADAAAALAGFAARLAKYRNWAQLSTAESPLGYWPYHLVIHVADGQGGHDLRPGEILTQGADYDIDIAADPQALAQTAPDPMFVYVIGFDCAGHSMLLYPRENMAGGAPLPSLVAGAPATRIRLRTVSGVDTPFGADSIFMLVTKEKISDVSVFDFDGVLSRGLTNPLDRLVGSLGATSRGGFGNDVPSDWTVQKIVIPNRPHPPE